MNIIVYCAPSFRDTLWFVKTYQGIAEEARRKKYSLITLDEIPENTDSLFSLFGEYHPVIIVLGASLSETGETLKRLNHSGVHTVLVNYRENAPYSNSSVIIMDYADATRQGIAYLKKNGAENIAFFGDYADSGPDEIKRNVFLEYGGNREDVFTVNENLNAVCEDFIRKRQKYDAVLFANDIAAVALTKKMRENQLELSNSVGFIDVDITDFSLLLPNTVSLSASHSEFGRQAVRLCAFLNKESRNISATIRIPINITDDFQRDFSVHAYPVPQERIIQDSLVEEIISVQKCLSLCDGVDRSIIKMLLKGKSNAQIAAGVFVSEKTVSYRINRLCQSIKAENQTVLIQKLSEWICDI